MMADLKAIISQLKKWSSCDVADGLSKLNHPHGGFLEGLTMYSPQFQSGSTKIIGQAFTVKFVPKADIDAPKLKGNYASRPNPRRCCRFHFTANSSYQRGIWRTHVPTRESVGAAGVIIDGRLRDLQEHRDLGFPIFAKGVGTTAGGEVCRPSEINVPVQLNSEIQKSAMRINPRDYIIADLDGVVCCPSELIEKVLEVIPAIAAADRKCADAIKNGMSVEEAFGKFRGK